MTREDFLRAAGLPGPEGGENSELVQRAWDAATEQAVKDALKDAVKDAVRKVEEVAKRYSCAKMRAVCNAIIYELQRKS